ncbi:MAG: hypothetical protein PUA96_06750 [Bacteroidales bacterium]|nr:hypothetical protein [Bacteroidales bacterium]
MQKIWKPILRYAGVILLFLAVAYGFVPQVLGGKIVNQSDISGYVGMAHEANEWNSGHPGDRTAWTNSMFGGMPTTMLTGNPEGDWTQKIYDAFLFGRRPASYLFISLLGAFFLMLSLGINWLLAVAGAVAVTFCSYNFQIIQVGHNTKMMAIAWLPWVLAALIFTYRSALNLYRSEKCETPGWRVWLPLTALGAALFGMTVNFQIKANHIQISYYLAIIIFCYVAGLFIWMMLDKSRRSATGRFFTASFLLLFLGLAGIGTNANKLIPTYLYSQHTMRGGSELAAGEQENGQKKSKGLDLDYATAWSYGWEELPNMMIPDFNGGSSSGAVNPSRSHTIKLLKQYGQGGLNELAKSLPMYWGPQPFTAGPMYMGAITIFLFLLGLFMCKGRDKWWILTATIIAIFLGVGRHFMPFTEFWYNYMPFYSKFRTVSMALIILQFTLPMLGFFALDKVLKGDYTGEQFRKPALAALVLTAGFCLLCSIFPGIAGSFEASSDSGMHPEIAAALEEDRRMLLSNDALVSAFMVLGTFLIIFWAYAKPKKASGNEVFVESRRMYAAGGICVLVLLNMWSVGKRYLNSGHFVKPREFNGQFAQRPADKAILEDGELGYRTLDLTVNVFNDSHPSYWHRNIGGYSPVKMQRYQDLIDRHLNAEINTLIGVVNKAGTMSALMEAFPYLPVLSMLNDKYVILDGNSAPAMNPYAMGNVWFVGSASVAESAEEEIGLLGNVDLGNVAVLGPDFRQAAELFPAIDGAADGMAARDTIYMTSYAPNELRYHYRLSSDKVAVFSEIYYPSGWKAWLDSGDAGSGKASPDKQEIGIFRADWTLRAAALPAGEHDLVMRFEPESYVLSANVSRASSALLLLLVLLSAGAVLVRSRLLPAR